MSLVESQVLEKLKCLSEAKQQEVLDFVEFLISRAAIQTTPVETQSDKSESFIQAAQQYVGYAEGPGDLSTNPDYMEGYGA